MKYLLMMTATQADFDWYSMASDARRPLCLTFGASQN